MILSSVQLFAKGQNAAEHGREVGSGIIGEVSVRRGPEALPRLQDAREIDTISARDQFVDLRRVQMDAAIKRNCLAVSHWDRDVRQVARRKLRGREARGDHFHHTSPLGVGELAETLGGQNESASIEQ